MTERSRVDTDRGLEAACSSLIDIELSALNGEDIHEIASQDIAKQPSSDAQKVPRIADTSTSKDVNHDKYIDQANFNRPTLCSRETDKGQSTQSTKLEPNRSQEVEQEENDNKELSMKTPSESEKEEGNYEELICLVRQFYVERPINPSAIAHQNIETC